VGTLERMRKAHEGKVVFKRVINYRNWFKGIIQLLKPLVNSIFMARVMHKVIATIFGNVLSLMGSGSEDQRDRRYRQTHHDIVKSSLFRLQNDIKFLKVETIQVGGVDFMWILVKDRTKVS